MLPFLLSVALHAAAAACLMEATFLPARAPVAARASGGGLLIDFTAWVVREERKALPPREPVESTITPERAMTPADAAPEPAAPALDLARPDRAADGWSGAAIAGSPGQPPPRLPPPSSEPRASVDDGPAPLPPRPAIEAEPVMEALPSGSLGRGATEAKADGPRNLPPDYPPVALARGWEGTVILRVEVLADGTAGEVTVQSSSGHDVLDAAAVGRVKGWAFIPATSGGVPVRSWLELPVRFVIRRK